jgi:hypothetical protein
MSVDPAYLGVLGFVFPTPRGCDYPVESDVRFGIVYGFGAYTGTLIVSSIPYPSATTLLVHSPADILRHALINLGVGPLPPTTPWPIFASSEPDVPDNCITVYDSLGNDDGRTMPNGTLQQHQGIQVRIRSLDHATGWTKSQQIRSILAEGIYYTGVLIGTTPYLIHSVNQIGNVLALGKEIPTSKRTIFVINAVISVRQIA